MFDEAILELTRGKHPFNPSRTATKRVKNPLPIPEICPHCDCKVDVVTHVKIYGRVFGEWPFVYYCNNCESYVGMHPFTNIPLGSLANKEMREARKRCKPYFDKLWLNNINFSRTDAYEWLAGKMNIPVEECHFGWFSVAQCEQAKTICDNAWWTK